MPKTYSPELTWFRHKLAAEGLSVLTISSYISDLAQVELWVQGRPLSGLNYDTLADYLNTPAMLAKNPRSVARLLSALRHFYAGQLAQGRMHADPSLKLSSPRLGLSLPKDLSETDVEALLAAPDVSTPLGLRDRAMLELLYACGLRVSELVGLEVGQPNLRGGYVRVTGKGSKERLVPMGELAAEWLQRYLDEGRPALVRGNASGAGRRRHGATDLLAPYQAACPCRRYRAAAVAAHPAPCLCHTPAESWRRPARGADAAGALRPVHHADLHPCRQGPFAGPARRAPSTGLIVGGYALFTFCSQTGVAERLII